MLAPEKWKETVDPFSIRFNNFKLIEVLGYPHARNDVFYCKGFFDGTESFCILKYASKIDSALSNEVNIINSLNFEFLPTIIDFDTNGKWLVTKEIDGERLSTILNTTDDKSVDYMFEYGQTLAKIHATIIKCKDVSHRKFFDIPPLDYLKEYNIDFTYEYLVKNKPSSINKCFCHGDFHYANILWKDHSLAGVLDWELSGFGNKEFDIAWAIINRPGQKFLKTKKEINEFLKGYKSIGSCNTTFVKYYMVLIYCYFISNDKENVRYQNFVKNWLTKNAK